MKNQFFPLLAAFVFAGMISLLPSREAKAQGYAVPVVWSGLSGVSVGGNTITNVGVANSWVNGGYSMQQVGPGGFVEFQAGEQATYKMIGLNSDPAADHSYCSIDYAWYPYSGGGYQVYENCGNPYGNGTAYSPSDVWKVYWNPNINRIEYIRNGVVQYTSGVVPSGIYYVDFSFYTSGASFTNVVVQQGRGLDCGNAVTWTGASGVSVGTGTITNIGTPNSWVNGAYNTTPVGPGGYVEFRAGETNTYKMLGFNSDPAADNSYCSIDYAWYPQASGTYCIYENCGNPYCGGAYSTNDVFKVFWNPSNNRIEYYVNDVLKYTSGVVPSATLYVDASLYTSGASFVGVAVNGSTCVPTMSTWGLIILGLISLALLSGWSLVHAMQLSPLPYGEPAIASLVAFVRSMPLDKKVLARALMYLMPITVIGFIAIHILIGTNGAVDFTGTMISAAVTGYIVHLAGCWKAQPSISNF